MTNTRITDPEVLEFRYPVQVQRFEVRRRSRGAGKWHGGDGVIRELLFLEQMAVSILSQHRKEKPYGLAGGDAGKPGRQRLIRNDGSMEKLRGIDSADVYPGDRVIIETPGGGGYGRRGSERRKASNSFSS
jgi:5-oxoprolinase (ATP-hydrolysing)